MASIAYTVPSETGCSENRIVPKQSQPIEAETDCDVVNCPTVGNKHWMFDTRSTDVVNQFAHFLKCAAQRILS